MKNQDFINLLPLKTKRLLIKPTTKDDIDMILKMDKQEQTQKYLGGIKNKSREERIKFLEKKENQQKEGKVKSLTVYLKDEIPIGFIGIDIDEQNSTAEISYIFDYDYSKKGYCTEACQKILSVCFKDLKLNKIVADTIDGNIASIKVLEKLGFTHTKTRKNEAFIEETNEYKDFLDYELLEDNYKDFE